MCSSDLKAVVSIAGPTDLTDPQLYQYLRRYCIGFSLHRFLGTTLKRNPQLYAQASPVFYHRPLPCLFINGDIDKLVPAQQAYRMFDTLRSYGIAADTNVLNNTGHYVYGHKNKNLPLLTSELIRWLKSYLP